MRIIKLILFFSIINYSVFSQENATQDIIIFEEIIGKEKAEALNKSVQEFEKILSIKYPSDSIEGSYKSFLREACIHEFYFWEFDSDTIVLDNIYHNLLEAGFESDLILKPSQIEIKEDGVYWQYIYKDKYTNDTIGIIQEHINPPIPKSIDSLYLKADKRRVEKKIIFNIYGDYIKALKKIQSRDSIISGYIEIKQSPKQDEGILRPSGFIGLSLIACGLYNSNANLSDYFIKRIILIEIFFN